MSISRQLRRQGKRAVAVKRPPLPEEAVFVTVARGMRDVATYGGTLRITVSHDKDGKLDAQVAHDLPEGIPDE